MGSLDGRTMAEHADREVPSMVGNGGAADPHARGRTHVTAGEAPPLWRRAAGVGIAVGLVGIGVVAGMVLGAGALLVLLTAATP